MSMIAYPVTGHQGPYRIAVLLVYDEQDPLAVTLLFPRQLDDDGTPVRWAFARTLLYRGLRGPAGDGDVRLWPEVGVLAVRLTSPDDDATFYVNSRIVANFLRATYRLVPAGAERVDVDAALGELLAGT